MEFTRKYLIHRIIPAIVAASAPISSLLFSDQDWLQPVFSQEIKGAEKGKAISPADMNWRYFWDNHLGTWEGRWTRYKPDGDVLETFRSSREFQSGPTDSQIRQVNRYLYEDGRTVDRSWSFSRTQHSRADGFQHPASADMRGLAFSRGAAAWLVPQLKQNSAVPLELFLMDGKVRTSVGLVYDKERKLVHTASIREDKRDNPGTMWSEDVEQGPSWELSGRWEGVTEVIRPDLSRSTEDDSELIWLTSTNQEYYFPDRIVLSCPPEIPSDAPFFIAARWQSGADQMQSILVRYDRNGRLSTVAHQRLRRIIGDPDSSAVSLPASSSP
jgi:hypothetical protein